MTDTAGNTATFTTPTVSIDLTAPVTTAATAGAQVTLTATDTLSGVASKFFSVDGSAKTTYTAPFTVSGAGTHTVSYWSADKAGNTEAAHSLS